MADASLERPGAELDDLETEARAPGRTDLDQRPTLELVELMNREDARVPAAVAAAAGDVAAAVDAIAARMAAGGRLVYAGAGTSGRLAALDAAECATTFSTEPGQVVALMAGGAGAEPAEQETAEDDEGAGKREVELLAVSPADAVVGVSASGRTPYVLGAVRAAGAAGALTVGIVNVRGSSLGSLVEHEIAVPVGPELLAGSTRLKAGSAQKLVLNTISTLTMIRLGKTFGDLMVDVHATNEKLHARVRRIVVQATGAAPEEAGTALRESGGDARVAIVALLADVDTESARRRLAAAGGIVRKALAP
jgi:N-acetylmuramic acid 6-phosphate etherase